MGWDSLAPNRTVEMGGRIGWGASTISGRDPPNTHTPTPRYQPRHTSAPHLLTRSFFRPPRFSSPPPLYPRRVHPPTHSPPPTPLRPVQSRPTHAHALRPRPSFVLCCAVPAGTPPSVTRCVRWTLRRRERAVE